MTLATTVDIVLVPRHLTPTTLSTGWLSLVVPIFMAAPADFRGSLTLGGVIMAAGAFSCSGRCVVSLAVSAATTYLQLGTSRNPVSYPNAPAAFADEDVRGAPDRCQLGNLIPKLDGVERWELPLVEQERIAFAAAGISRARVFPDEATPAATKAASVNSWVS